MRKDECEMCQRLPAAGLVRLLHGSFAARGGPSSSTTLGIGDRASGSTRSRQRSGTYKGRTGRRAGPLGACGADKAAPGLGSANRRRSGYRGDRGRRRSKGRHRGFRQALRFLAGNPGPARRISGLRGRSDWHESSIKEKGRRRKGTAGLSQRCPPTTKWGSCR